jgi:hypothetical protein
VTQTGVVQLLHNALLRNAFHQRRVNIGIRSGAASDRCTPHDGQEVKPTLNAFAFTFDGRITPTATEQCNRAMRRSDFPFIGQPQTPVERVTVTYTRLNG